MWFWYRSLCGRFVAVLVCGRFGCTPSADGLVLVLSAARIGKQEANPWKSLGLHGVQRSNHYTTTPHTFAIIATSLKWVNFVCSSNNNECRVMAVSHTVEASYWPHL